MRFERNLLRVPDLVLADTRAHAEYYAALAGLPENRVAVVPVGVDTDVFARQPPPTPERVCRVLFYGSYIPLHGVETILHAAKLAEGTPIHFRMIGRGQTRASADALARQLSLANTTFIDWVPLASLVDEIAAADIVLGIFGVSEKAARVVPNKVYQAMSVGRCVITRDSPAIREMFVPSKHLAVCAAGDPDALASAILALRADPARVHAMAEAGQSLVRTHYSAAAIGAAALTALSRVARR
jgi:glycosyltransferase involved in cell wall biosynthesis